MPTAYRIDPEAGIVWSRAWGVLVEGETAQHLRQLAADPDFRPTYRHFCDLRAVERMAVSTDAVRAIARAGLFAPEARRVFLAPADVHYGLSRMLQTYVEIEGAEIGVFRTPTEAAAWLGIPEAAIEASGQHEPDSSPAA